jgi:hypothetical protein
MLLEHLVEMNKILTLAAVAVGAGLAFPAAALTIDGNLTDWGINPATWAPAPGSGIQSTIEDGTGGGSYFLNPGWGGQAYDAEALYAKLSLADQKLYIALATGHNPRTLNQPSANSYGAGDFALDFGKDGSYEVGINIKHAVSLIGSSDYTLESFGVEGGVEFLINLFPDAVDQCQRRLHAHCAVVVFQHLGVT